MRLLGAETGGLGLATKGTSPITLDVRCRGRITLAFVLDGRSLEQRGLRVTRVQLALVN